jgi:hypothetical protein
MKKILLLSSLLCFQFAQSQIQLISDVSGVITLKNESAEINFVSVQNDLVLPVIESGKPMLRKGTPDLPRTASAVIVDDTFNMNIHILSSEYVEYPNIEVAPSKGNLIRNVDPSTIPFEYGPAYNQDAFFPGNLASLGEAYVQNQYRGQAVYFYPVQYNPITKVLRHYTEITISVLPGDEMGQNPLPTAVSQRTNLVMNEMYAARFLNYNQHQNRYDVVGELGNMLVISDAAYMETLAPWVSWKKEKGIPTEVVDVAEIGGISAIASFVEDYYNDNGLTYVVLVGDEDQVPTQLVNNSGGQGYCDACYSYVSGDDSYGEFFLGRFLVHTPTELEVLVEKILEYEKNPYMATDWYSVAVGIGSNEGAGIGDDGEEDWEHANDTKEDLLDFTYTEVWELYESTHTSSSPTGGETADESGNPTASDLSAIINDGCSLINYTGHGNHSIISTTGFTNTNINALTNYHKYPYFIIVGCCVGDFDDDSGSGDTFGEAWIKADDATGPTGGIGGAFSSVFQSWAPPMEGQDEMNHIIADMVNYETRHTFGSIHNHGCASMNDVYGGGGDDMTDTWHLMGDPSVQLRTAFPEALVVDHLETAFIGISEFEVLCDVEDALVSLTIDGEIIGTSLVSGGMATVSFETIVVPGTILVTVTSFNTIPYQGFVTLIVADGPYVVDQTVLIDDLEGNNNTLADHGESVDIDISLENVGIETAYGVEATLSSTDGWVVITDDYHFYGDILATSDLMAENAYAFDVINGVEDQHIAHFSLAITDSEGNAWDMNFTIILNAPVLSCGEFTLTESGGNGRLEEGETAELTFTVTNNGHASTVVGLDAILTESSAYVIPDNTSELTVSVEPGETVSVTFPCTVASEVPDGELFEFSFSAGTAYYSTMCSFEEVIDIIMEDWETGDISNFSWELDGDSDWFTTALTPYEGTYCMQSGVIADGDQTILKLTLDFLEAGEVNFAFRTSSEAGWDELSFKIDGNTLGSWSGENEWVEVSYPITAGSHTLRWTYEKDAFCCIEGEDAVWIDNVSFPAHSPVGIDENTTRNMGLTLYPNPTEDRINVMITSPLSTSAQIKIFDIMGREVYNANNQVLVQGQNQLTVPVQNLESGNYTIHLLMDSQAITAPFIKM